MATIPFPGGTQRHVRKVITFTGGAGAGELDSPITVAPTTGRVLITEVAFAETTTMVSSSSGDIYFEFRLGSLATVGAPFFSDLQAAPQLAKWASGDGTTYTPRVYTAEDLVLVPVNDAAGANITQGAITVDVFYIPLTNDGALAGDDSDIEMDDYIADQVWAEGIRTLTAIDEDSTTLDIDAAVRTALGLASANLDTQLAAIPTLAELQSELGGLNDLDGTAIAAAVWGAASRTLTALGFTLGASDLAADTIGASELAADAITEIVNGVWTTALTEAYNTDGAAPTGAQALFVIMQRLVDFAISGTTITVKKIDGTTTAYTLTLDDANSPTSSARAT